MSTSTDKAPKRSNVVKVLHWGDDPPQIIAMIGSPRFQSHFQGAARAYAVDGHIVLVPHAYANTSGQGLNQSELDAIHQNTIRQIDMADRVFVINPQNVIPDHVRDEIEYAKSLGRRVTYLETPASK